MPRNWGKSWDDLFLTAKELLTEGFILVGQHGQFDVYSDYTHESDKKETIRYYLVDRKTQKAVWEHPQFVSVEDIPLFAEMLAALKRRDGEQTEA